MNVLDAVTAWISYRHRLCELGLVAGSTLKNQTAAAHALAAALGALELDQLRKSNIEIWMGERLRTCAPITVRGELNVLRQILNWCVDEGLLLAKPRLPTLLVPNTEAALPSDAAFLWVLANVPPQHSVALEFMMLTGLSPHELERVQVRDMPRVVGTAQGEPGERRYLGIGQRPDFLVKQASRRRWVPLSDRAQQLWFEVSAGMRDNDHVFSSSAAMQKAIRRAVADFQRDSGHPDWTGRQMPAGAVAITPKLMRKWFASKVAGEQPEHVLQRLMGHAPGSPITRRHYVRSTEDQVSAAVSAVTL